MTDDDITTTKTGGKERMTSLEPIALAVDKISVDQTIALSTAISLKRLADVIAGHQLTDLVHDLQNPISNMAYEAGRAFASGQRQ